MKRCSDCRHWTGEPYTFRAAGRPTEASEHRKCAVAGSQYEPFRDEQPTEMLFVLANADYGGELWTRANFGCVLWDVKDA